MTRKGLHTYKVPAEYSNSIYSISCSSKQNSKGWFISCCLIKKKRAENFNGNDNDYRWRWRYDQWNNIPRLFIKRSYDRSWPRSKRLKSCRRTMKYFRLQKDLRYRWGNVLRHGVDTNEVWCKCRGKWNWVTSAWRSTSLSCFCLVARFGDKYIWARRLTTSDASTRPGSRIYMYILDTLISQKLNIFGVIVATAS